MLFVDNFAGGGGASTGIETAIGRSVDIAINHDPDAIAMHKVNHPKTKHYCEDVWQVDPIEACEGKTVALVRANLPEYCVKGEKRHDRTFKQRKSNRANKGFLYNKN